MLSIVSWGGIGDTLRNLSLVPHEFLYRNLGLRPTVSYVSWRRTGAHAHALAPEAGFFQELVDRCPSLRWVGEVEKHRGPGRMLNRALREILRCLNGGEAVYFPFTLPLTESERQSLPKLTLAPTIGIQTHLDGMHTKRWGVERWQQFLGHLQKEYPRLQIILLDAAFEVQQLCTTENISSTCELNIYQSIAMFEYFDLVLSIDSWSKYVATWKRIPQVIIVPDQRSEYPGLSAEKLAREEFSGIWRNPRNHIIGLSGTTRAPQLTLPSLADLHPQALLSELRPRIDAVMHKRRHP